MTFLNFCYVLNIIERFFKPSQCHSLHSSQLLSNTCVTARFLTLFNVFSVTDGTAPPAATAAAAEHCG